MKKLTIAIVVIVIIGAAIWYFKSPTPANAPAQQSATVAESAVDTTTSINKELQLIDADNVDADFNSINQDINTL